MPSPTPSTASAPIGPPDGSTASYRQAFGRSNGLEGRHPHAFQGCGSTLAMVA